MPSHHKCVFSFLLPVFIFITCAKWSEKPISTTDISDFEYCLFIITTSIKDLE
jgi:hypothetical protein